MMAARRKYMEEDIKEIIGRDVISVTSLCRTGLDNTIQTGFALTGAANTDPPPIPDKSGAPSYVEEWLETLPTFVELAPTCGALAVPPPR